MKHPANLVNNGQRLLRRRFWPSLSRQFMQIGEGVFCVFGKVLGRIVHQREPVIGGVHGVYPATVLHNKVTESLFSLFKVCLLSCLNVFKVDFHKGVPEKKLSKLLGLNACNNEVM